MKTLRILMLMLIVPFCLFSFTVGHADEYLIQQQQKIESTFERIYVTPDRVFIYPEGIFYLNEAGELALARLVSSDTSGLYVVVAVYKCPACGRGNRNGVCINPACPLYGK